MKKIAITALILFIFSCSSVDTEVEKEMLQLTTEELSEFDGQNGNESYIAVDGTIYDVTNSANVGYFGTVQHSYNGVVTSSFFNGRHTISGATVYEIRHRCEITQSAGFGQESGFYTNTYTVVEIFKES